MIDVTKIDHIRALYASKRKVESDMHDALQPKIRTDTLLSFLFGALTAAETERDVKLFVLLYLAAPEVLAGQKMRKGLRPTFTTLFGYKTGSAISVRNRDLLFRYQTYSAFHAKVDEAMVKAENFLQTFKHTDSDE